MKNRIYYGDNLDILRRREYFPDECVDLIYLDPPFNSNRNYNVLFKSESGADSPAQITAFEDTWHWGETAEATYDDLIVAAPPKVSTAIEALMNLIDRNQMMAYLVMMTARLVELRRVLKPTGSLYLHCDPTASHYLKIVLDAIFGAQNYRNEITWKRYAAHSLAQTGFDNIADIILFYSYRQSQARFNKVYGETDEAALAKRFPHVESETGRRFQHIALEQSSNHSSAGEIRSIQGRDVISQLGWRWSQATFDQRISANPHLIYWTSNGRPRYKKYADEYEGAPLGNIWTDIEYLAAGDSERLSYPTQKPLKLLERIILASSNEGDIVLDPFCGCGTAIAAAHKLRRHWVGIDITHLSIALQKYRLADMFELVSGTDYEVIGEPTTVEGARALARDSANDGRYQFEWWALSLLRAKPVGGKAGSRRGKKGADQGIDGIISFFDEDGKGRKKPRKVIVQVKSGAVKAGDIRDLKGAVEREKAAIGAFITLAKPSSAMIKEALAGGYYESPRWGRRYRRLQILTIGDLFGGASVDMPPQYAAHRRAERYKPTAVSEEGKSQRNLM